MIKLTKSFIVLSAIALIASQSAFANTDKKTFNTSGSLGKNTGYAQTDTNDFIWPLTDDIVSSTHSDSHEVYLTVKGTIYWNGGSANDSNSTTGKSTSVRVNTNGTSYAGVSGQGSHGVVSADWGNWSGTTSVTF